MSLPARKKLRLEGYDYSSNGLYFVTICVKDKHEILGHIVVGANCVRPVPSVRPILSEYGKIVEMEITALSETYDAIEVINYVVMPNHIHIVISINNDWQTQVIDKFNAIDGEFGVVDGGRTQFAPTISRVIKQFKGSITKKIGVSIWQRSYHDHIIRNEQDYCRIAEYIENNPAKWMEDIYFKPR